MNVSGGDVWAIEFNSTVRTANATGGVRFQVSAPSGTRLEGWLDGSGTALQTKFAQRMAFANTGVPSGLSRVANTETPANFAGTVNIPTGAPTGPLSLLVYSLGAGGTLAIYPNSFFGATKLTY